MLYRVSELCFFIASIVLSCRVDEFSYELISEILLLASYLSAFCLARVSATLSLGLLDLAILSLLSRRELQQNISL